MFHDLLDREVESIVIDCTVKEFEQSELVLKKGNRTNCLTIVIDGEVELQRASGQGVKLGPGTLFGELILLNEDLIAADVKASSKKVHIVEIPYEKIYKYYAENLRIYGILMANLAKMLARRLKKAGQKS